MSIDIGRRRGGIRLNNLSFEVTMNKDYLERSSDATAFKDQLTGLYNRDFFFEEMERLEKGRRFPITVMVADLDDLRIINANLGQAAGDLLLQEASRLLQEVVRGEDVVARIGADEFAILLPDTDAPSAAHVLERLRENEAIFNRETDGPRMAISLGVATVEEKGELKPVLLLADQRMLEDKIARRARANGAS